MIDGNKIRFMREQKGLNQTQLGELVGVEQSMIGYIERGIKRPSVELLARIAECLGVKMDDLIRKEEVR